MELKPLKNRIYWIFNDFYFSVCLLNNLFELAGEPCRFLPSELEDVAQEMINRNGDPEDIYLRNKDFSLCVINEFICNLDLEEFRHRPFYASSPPILSIVTAH